MISASVERKAWKGVACQLDGAGAEDGIDMTAALKLANQLAAEGDWKKHGLLRFIMQGGQIYGENSAWWEAKRRAFGVAARSRR